MTCRIIFLDIAVNLDNQNPNYRNEENKITEDKMYLGNAKQDAKEY